MAAPPAIQVRHLSKVYELGLSGRSESLLRIFERRVRHPITGRRPERERFVALDDLSFDVAEGEAVGVVGRNGAGKSTLLKIISRITPPSAGYIDLRGNVGSLLEVGTGFHPELTGIENVYLNGNILGMTKAAIDRRIDEIVAFSEVERFLDTPVKRYSSGMRVRLAFAVAAHLDPDVLIVDEVLSVGDAGFQAKCIAKMKAVATEEGRTVLYVTHNLVTLEHFCPRSLLLVDGRLDFDGPTVDTVARYLAQYPTGERGTEAGVFDLDGADRSGTDFERVFTRVEFRPGGAMAGDVVRTGDRLQIVIDVEGFAELTEPVLILGVFTNQNERVFEMRTGMTPLLSAHEGCARQSIVIDIPEVPLTPSEYWLSLHVKDGNRTLDVVRHAATFQVVPADVSGSGFGYSADNGHVIVPFEWEVRPTDRVAVPGAVDSETR
jgi:lipopolysaccharide transport system ATP-binding protein